MLALVVGNFFLFFLKTMQKITLAIKNDKVPFFMDLIKNFKFIQVKDQGDSKKEIVRSIQQAVKDAKLFREGKLETITEEDFLKELDVL
ncbi:MAG: hypothetical protein K2X94_00925 [Amoebophilaceae bacterium]|nr:hypothetical protein [Amoebophilaceae bacterium]